MPEFLAKDPDYTRRVRASFDRQTIMGLIGARLAGVEPGVVEIELPFREDLCQQHGFFHAGVTSTIADSAGGYAGFSLFPAEASILTVEFKINLLAPVSEGTVTATATVVSMSKRMAVVRIDVENDGRLVALAQGTSTIVPPRPPAS